MTDKKRQVILKAFQAKFPKAWFKDGKEFDGGSAVLWSGEGSEINGRAAFNYNWWEFDPEEKIYVSGVLRPLAELAEKFGLYWESNDPGTYLAREI